ncbi:glycoside hydrolase family 28 protein / polygalacturonase pectinase family protein [Prunus dulcis]|uniref:Glycoside hydrolase family 28 protein / polygalacturonase pectinase family protein n=1 Tax=Prunus dulcis TaxID=3755 RepID=A0A4Y1RGM0_PRUDU|nr:glycoside hydrolase family 28 protein / polygalacturonase pectinase family protein [Prunus dulcis]
MCFKFPKVVCNEISSDIAKFWWGKSEGGNGIHWKSWKALCLAKGDGGLGFRDLAKFNLALLAKQTWRIIPTPNALWVRILKARNYPDCEFKDAVLGHRPSWIWTSILEGRDVLMGRARVQIMNGADTNIWGNNWIPDNGIITPITHVPSNAPQMVSDIINMQNRTWSLDRVGSYLSWETQKQILAILIGSSGQRDKLVWPWTSNGLYSVKSSSS